MTGFGAKFAKLQVPVPLVTRQVALLAVPPPALSPAGTLLGALAVPPPLTASGSPVCWYVNFVGAIWVTATGDGVLKLGLPTLAIVIVSPAGSWNCWVAVIVTVPFKRCAPLVAAMVSVGCGNAETGFDCV